MTTYCIKSAGKKNARQISETQLEAEVEQSKTDLQQFARSSDRIAPDMSRGILHRDFESVNVLLPGHYSINTTQYRDKRGNAATEQFKADISKASVKNFNFINNLQAGKITFGMWFYGVYHDSGGTSIEKTMVFQGAVCPVCHEIVQSEDIIGHRQASKCYDQFSPPEGYIRFADKPITAISKAGNIPYVFGPVEYGVYIPRWVADALSAWEGGLKGYAGLSLAEYLRKLADDHSSEE